MKKTLLLGMLFTSPFFYAQETEVVSDSTWIKKGNIAILGSQSSFSQWQAGGSNNLAINVSLNYDIINKKGDSTWDNKFIAMYCIHTLKGKEQQKTDDGWVNNTILSK